MPTAALDFIEEPIRDQSPQAYKSLRSMCDVPFTIGEEFSSKWVLLPTLKQLLLNLNFWPLCPF